MTDAELQAILERAEKASPGPWEWRKGDVNPALVGSECPVLFTCTIGDDDPTQYLSVYDFDAAFIAAARTDIPLLVEEVRRLRSELTDLRARWVAEGYYKGSQ